MLYFIPAWYQENNWCETEQYWHARRMRTEFDDTVKQIQLFHRSQAYPFRIMLLSFAPNFRHFLHRQGVFHAPYWSCFDAIQEIRRKKVKMFSFHNLNWPEHIEFVYSPFALIALLHGEKYAQVEFGEDGNPIQVDIYRDGMIQRRNVYDDRGFVSSTILYENGQAIYQDYLTDRGIWKIRYYLNDGHIEVNPKCPTYLLEYEGEEIEKSFLQPSYESMEQVIFEVFSSYLKLTKEEDIFCAAMHELHTEVLKMALRNTRRILSFYGDRYDIEKNVKDLPMIEAADYIITDSKENVNRIQKMAIRQLKHITDITPFDSRVDFGISQQLNVQKILVPVDGMEEDRLKMLIVQLGNYLKTNENAQVHLFTRLADYDRKKVLLAQARNCLKQYGMEEGWAAELQEGKVAENATDAENAVPVRFFVEQCVDELAVSKCMREQRLVVDMRKITEVYLQIMGISVGIPQIVYRNTQFVDKGKNGMVVRELDKIPEAVSFYLDNLTNWNEAVVASYELGKNYTTGVLIDKWKEVIDFVGRDSHITSWKY